MNAFYRIILVVCLLLFFKSCSTGYNEHAPAMPNGFVDINSFLSGKTPPVAIEVRYMTSNNFVGRPIAGYEAEKILMSTEAASAIGKVQADLAAAGMGLKIFDAYRPQQAVDHFVRWASDLNDEAMKQQYYPNIEKANLFRDGYIAERSGHSRGSTVDLTIVDLASGDELDMGSPWDYFDPISWPTSDLVNPEQKRNRNLLRDVMIKHGFSPLPEEWWHFILDNEPFPDTYFDFPVK